MVKLSTKQFLTKMSDDTLLAIWTALYTDLTNQPQAKLVITAHMNFIDKLLRA